MIRIFASKIFLETTQLLYVQESQFSKLRKSRGASQVLLAEIKKMSSAVAKPDANLKDEIPDLTTKRPIEVESPIEPKKQKLDNDEVATENTVNENVKKDRVKLRKTALLLGYSGKGYYGMQKNPGVITIEDELLDALVAAKLIQPEHRTTPQEVGFQRAARTDKGVSAVRQVVSLKVPQKDDYTQDVKIMNENLPPQIRVFGIKRTTKGFNSKNQCDYRTYSYMCPSFAFAPESVSNPDETYRISDEQLKAVNDFLAKYKGTHNYHNFTAGRKSTDASCNRYMVTCECNPPFIRDGLEFVRLTFKGQSFMLHQIRKMTGLCIAVMRGVAPMETLAKAWASERVDIPIAPGLGLMLEFVHYHSYDKHYGGDGFHEKLDWMECEDEINKFSSEFIIPSIVKEEKETKSMLTWMEMLPLHSYDVNREEGENSKLENVIKKDEESVKTALEEDAKSVNDAMKEDEDTVKIATVQDETKSVNEDAAIQ